jgi:hypothetical protein
MQRPDGLFIEVANDACISVFCALAATGMNNVIPMDPRSPMTKSNTNFGLIFIFSEYDSSKKLQDKAILSLQSIAK